MGFSWEQLSYNEDEKFVVVDECLSSNMVYGSESGAATPPIFPKR